MEECIWKCRTSTHPFHQAHDIMLGLLRILYPLLCLQDQSNCPSSARTTSCSCSVAIVAFRYREFSSSWNVIIFRPIQWSIIGYCWERTSIQDWRTGRHPLIPRAENAFRLFLVAPSNSNHYYLLVNGLKERRPSLMIAWTPWPHAQTDSPLKQVYPRGGSSLFHISCARAYAADCSRR